MRATNRYFGLFAAFLLSAPAILAQTNPPPPDPHEMVTHQPRVLTKPADRSAALNLLDRARQNYNLHDISSPYTLKVSFETSGTTLSEGDGTMDEVSDGAGHWRWAAQLQDSQVVRIGDQSRVYGTSSLLPLRVQMLRSALHWPIVRNAGASVIRQASIENDGKPLSCLLLSGAIPENPAPRAWVETEYCVDTATGFLRTWSAAPGIYAIYDYDGAAEFHGYTLPRQISIFEDGQLAVKAQIGELTDARDIDAQLFQPTQEMVDAGGSFTLASPNRFPMRVDPSDAPTSTYFQPVIVHAILDAQDGTVLDAEALQNADRELSRSALELVKSASFPASGFQQEVFINVQFHLPALEAGGPPILHPSVLWVIWEHRGKTPPARKPPHTGS